MHILNKRGTEALPSIASQTPESVFTERYDWLLRWAMHFTKNDRNASEDLVQDTLVRLIVVWPSLKGSVDQTEAILYSFLKYAYLTQLRRSRRLNLHELSAIEFDDFQLSLREERSVGTEELQHDLRRIVAYLCWRKRSSKSASVLILRFFHGYFPGEIARITRMKRNSVDKLLGIAREEVKNYLADSSRIRIAPKGGPPRTEAQKSVIDEEEFARELRFTILQARSTPCLGAESLLHRCRATEARPVDCELLAHIVSCAPCLHTMTSDFNPDSDEASRSGDSVLAFARRPGRGGGPIPPASSEEIRRSIAGGRDRFRKIYEHHPRSLMVLVNGDVLATRDVSSGCNEMKVLTALEKSLGIVEVMSEQGLSMLTLYVPVAPPDAPPEMGRHIELSDGRSLQILLQFRADSAVIDLRYTEPGFLAAPRGMPHAALAPALEVATTGVPPSVLQVSIAPTPRRLRLRSLWLQRIRDRIAQLTKIPRPEMNPMLATAIVCGFAAIGFFVLSLGYSASIKPSDLLTRAGESESAPARSGADGVIVQTVRIQTPTKKTERTLYRDVQGRRRTKEKKLGTEDADLRAMLETAGLGWDDPLSAASFGSWHARAAGKRDAVKRLRTGLLTLTTTASEGDVLSESLTVREADLHTVQRTVQLRDAGTIEIAELNYSVLPWNSLNPQIFGTFDGAPAPAGGRTFSAQRPRLPTALTSDQIDEAELGAQLVLGRLHLDASGRIQLQRQQNGVRVDGIVDDEATKQQLEAQLRLIPHAVPSILTLHEMETRPGATSEVTSVRQFSAAAADPSALDRFFKERGLEVSRAGEARQTLVDASFKVKYESDTIAGLLYEFASKQQLSPSARTALSELLVQHKAALLAALGSEEREMIGLRLIGSPSEAPAETSGDAAALQAEANRNFALCGDLTSGSAPPSTSAQAIAPQLAGSISMLRALVLSVPTAQLISPPVPADLAGHNT